MSAAPATGAKGSAPSKPSRNPSGNPAIPHKTTHIPQFMNNSNDPVISRLQDQYYIAGTPLFVRNPDVERILAAVSGLTPSMADLPVDS
ncbi:hypothetical protein G7Z17_g984 [Cylindrodendrum hubeiense]|uniref:Uncharacterized protein n=1 Tax=Cylindrodendrum hubeiense TaxID=595255 RepID=A0A9P5HQW5_9HYPO|nr:hypothetical protein G7Z17_g984 [Cylindrodendrum hubeiense]